MGHFNQFENHRNQVEIDAGYLSGRTPFLQCGRGVSEPGATCDPVLQAMFTARNEFEENITIDPLWGIPPDSPMAEFVAKAAPEPERRNQRRLTLDEQAEFLSRGIQRKSERTEKVVKARREYISRRGCCGGVCGIDGACPAVPGGICPKVSLLKVVKFMSELINFDETLKQSRAMIAKADGELARTIAIAKGINAVKEAIEQHKDDIMAIQGSPLGYLVDRCYEWPIVKRVMVEALIRGFSMVGGETMILADKFYGLKPGYRRNIEQFPGVSKLEVNTKNPTIINKKMVLVSGYIRLELNGVEVRKTFDDTGKDGYPIPVKISEKLDSDDQAELAMGKAERKMLAKMYVKLTGIPTPDADDDDMPHDPNVIDGTPTAVKQEALPAPELSDADKTVIADMDRDIDMVPTKAALTQLYKALEKHHPHLVDILKPKFTAKKEALDQKALAS